MRLVSTLDSVWLSSVESALQASQLRSQVYANNIANANTPGYKRQTVQFESILQASLGNLSSGAGLSMAANNPLDLGGIMPGQGAVSPIVVTDNSSAVSSNGNNVNMDAEMSDLAENQIDYSALVQNYNTQYDMLRTAITGG
jgi:flagellar basal-body rod protein FlgB